MNLTGDNPVKNKEVVFMKKILSLLLILVMLVPFSSALAEEEKPVFVITLDTNPKVSDYYDNYFTNWVEETFDVKLEFQLLPTTDSDSKLTAMVAAGEDLGDLMLGSYDSTMMMNFGDAGAIYDLSGYFAEQDTNIEAFGEQISRNILADVTTATGEIWCYPCYQNLQYNSTKYRAWINETWLENLNLEMPTTPDELYEVLKAFKEQDANGNGDPDDEIPMLGCTSGWSTDPTPFLLSPFVYWDDVNMLTLEDGKIDAAYTQESYREGLAYIKKLIDEGLLATDTFSITDSQYQEYLNTETPTVGMYFFTHAGKMDPNGENVKQYVWVPYMFGADGVQRISYQPVDAFSSPRWMIPTSAKDPDASFALIDALTTQEAHDRSRFGVEGVHYERTGDDPQYNMIEFGNGWPAASSNMSWYVEIGTHLQACELLPEDPDSYVLKRKIAVDEMVKLIPEEYVPLLSYTTEEYEERTELLNNISTYFRQCKTMFILGEMSLEKDWDSYISNLYDGLKLARYIEIEQTAYDRLSEE